MWGVYTTMNKLTIKKSVKHKVLLYCVKAEYISHVCIPGNMITMSVKLNKCSPATTDIMFYAILGYHVKRATQLESDTTDSGCLIQHGVHIRTGPYPAVCIISTYSILLYFDSDFTEIIQMGPINNYPPMVQIMAWRRACDKPLSEKLLAQLTDASVKQI